MLFRSAVDKAISESVTKRLFNLGVAKENILTVAVPDDRKSFIKRFLDISALKTVEANKKKGILSRA